MMYLLKMSFSYVSEGPETPTKVSALQLTGKNNEFDNLKEAASLTRCIGSLATRRKISDALEASNSMFLSIAAYSKIFEKL